MIAIAIDGPSGAGKSTIAKSVAKELGFAYVDTGALYRAIGLYMSNNGLAKEDSENITSLLPKIVVDLTYIDGVQHVLLNGEDVSDKIRTPQMSMWASAVSAIPSVRAFLLSLQRELATKHDVIMDGRDIGTVVLPNAAIKIFLTAKPEERAKRRFDELASKGINVTFDDVLQDVITRDYNDSHREIAPLKPADDSILVDTTGYSLEKSITVLKSVIDERMKVVM